MSLRERNRKNIISRWKRIHQKDREYIKRNRKKTLIFRARICGFLAGDGNILIAGKGKNKHNTLRFYPDHPSLIDSFEEALLKVFNKKPKVKKKDKHYEITLDSKPAVEEISTITNFGTYNWGIPTFATTEEKVQWLRAFFDCESHIHEKYIRLQSVNERGIAQTKALLEEFDINSKIYTYQPRNPNHNKVFMLTITSKRDRKKYLDTIGFNHTTKLKKLKEQFNFQAAIA